MPHDSQFRTDRSGDDEFRKGQCQSRQEGNQKDTFQGFYRAADNEDDEEGTDQIEGQQLQTDIRRKQNRSQGRSNSLRYWPECRLNRTSSERNWLPDR